jgi:rare lipoprotein A
MSAADADASAVEGPLRLTGTGSAALGLLVGLLLALPLAAVSSGGGSSADGAPKAVAVAVAGPKLQVVESFQGEATWYGPGMEGGVRADGGPFDAGQLAAAHPTLAFGTVVRVSRLDDGRSVTVVVNDRLPEQAVTRIDLTRGAGEAIGMIDEGRVGVLLEVLG